MIVTRALFFSCVLAFALPTCVRGAVIGQVTGTSINPTTNGGWMDYLSGIELGEAPPAGTGLSITATASILDVDDSYNSFGTVTYRIGGSTPPPTPDPGIATFKVIVRNQDPSTNPADYLTQFRLRILDNYTPGVTLSSPTQPSTFSLITSSISEFLWQDSNGVGPGDYEFGFQMAIPKSTLGNTFKMEFLLRNGIDSAATPEPGSMALAGIAVAILSGGALVRRRRAKHQAEGPATN